MPSQARRIPIDPVTQRSYHYWHAFVPEVAEGQLYAYRVDGPHEPERGLRFDADKVLLDPYGRAVVVPSGYRREAACRPGSNAAEALKSVVVDSQAYDWEDDVPLRRPSARTIVYEMHVRGFTRHPNSGVPEDAAGPTPAWSTRFPTCRSWASRPSSCCRSFSLTPRIAPPGWSITGATPRSGYSPRTTPTARAAIRSARSTNSATWSRPCTEPASK